MRSKEAEQRFDIVLYVNGMPVVIVELDKQREAIRLVIEQMEATAPRYAA